MHLVTYCYKNDVSHAEYWGIWYQEAGYVIDVLSANPVMPPSLRCAVEHAETLFPLLQDIHAQNAKGNLTRIPIDAVILRAPYDNPPRNIICTGLNYAEHQQEFTRADAHEESLPEFPFLFTKPCTAIAHPDSTVDGHAHLTQQFDYEVELAVIIGKGGRDIAQQDALDYVFGYAIMNDLSARDLQRRTSQWYAGKSLDGSAPFGPCIVHKSAIADPQNLRITSRVNGEVRQDSHTSRMIFPVATLVHIISQGTTLLPGDIIATGTPAGVGMGLNPPQFLKAGDIMELEIEGVGILRNKIS